MATFRERIMSYAGIQRAFPEQQEKISEIANQGFKRPVMIMMHWYEDRIVAAAGWRGLLISYNYMHLGELDQEMLEYQILRHELIHCILMQYDLGVAFKEPYYYRFHEALAYHLGGPEAFYTFMDALNDERPGAPQKILRRALELKKEGKSTYEAKNQACEDVTEMPWYVMRDMYIAEAEKVIGRSYPRETIAETYVRYEDYLEWKKKQEKEKKEAETKPKETPKEEVK